MKISKIAKLVKNTGCIQLIQIDVDKMYLGAGGVAVYATEGLPLISGRDQARIILDLTKDQMDKIEVVEDAGTLTTTGIINFNMKADDKKVVEWETRRIEAAAMIDGKIVDVLELEGGEILLFDNDYLSPLNEEQKSPYFKLRVRENEQKKKYIVAYDGLFIKAAIMPTMVNNEYFQKLDSFLQAMEKIRPTAKTE